MTTATQIPLPHFLNLPLPPIPPDNSSSFNHVFKLNLSSEQFQELLNLDAEIEEGEEGGLRIEFDQSGKGKLHLSPNRLLLLDSPRSGPSRTNKPEEIYRHTPTSTSSSSSSLLTGLLRIPTSSCVFNLQPSPISDPTPTSSYTSPPDPTPSHQPNLHNSHLVKNERLTAELAQKEKLAGQRLKEKRLEEDKKKKEKQMVVLPDVYSSAPATKRTRQTKSKASLKQQFTAAIKSQSTTTISTMATLPLARNQTLPASSVAQPLPLRRALPGSQTGKHLAHVHNQHLSHSSTPPLKPAVSQSQPEPPPLTQSLPIPAPPAVVFKPPNSNKRATPVTLNEPTLPQPKSAPEPEPPSATVPKASPGPSSSSDDGADHHLAPARTHTHEPPTPPFPPLKHTDSSHVPKSPPESDVLRHGTRIQPPHIPVVDPSSRPSASDKAGLTTLNGKRSSSKRSVELSNGKTSDYSSQVQHDENLGEWEENNKPSKQQRAAVLSPNPNPNPATPSIRPRKTQKRNETDRRPTESNLEPNHFIETPPSTTRPIKTEDLPRKPTITVKKIPVPAPTEVNHSVATSQVENADSLPIIRKRNLEAEVAGNNVLNKRVRQDEGGSGLPTIRKVVRAPVVNGERLSATPTTNGKRVKKKKKLKQPIDYTSSEVEEGEEPGEIVRSSARTRPPPPAVTTSTAVAIDKEVIEAPKPHVSTKVTPVPIRPESPIEELPVSKPIHKTNQANKLPPPSTLNPPPLANTEYNNGTSAYHNSRLLFHKLSKHYEFVSLRLEEFKENKRKITSFQEVEELLCEAFGLEIELDRIKNRIIRNYS